MLPSEGLSSSADAGIIVVWFEKPTEYFRLTLEYI